MGQDGLGSEGKERIDGQVAVELAHGRDAVNTIDGGNAAPHAFHPAGLHSAREVKAGASLVAARSRHRIADDEQAIGPDKRGRVVHPGRDLLEEVGEMLRRHADDERTPESAVGRGQRSRNDDLDLSGPPSQNGFAHEHARWPSLRTRM